MTKFCFGLLACAGLALYGSAARADQFYLLGDMACDAQHSVLKVRFRGYANEAGEAAIARLGPDGVDPEKLRDFKQTADGRYTIVKRKSVKSCRLAGATYTVAFEPAFGPGFSPEGFCATRTGLRAEVRLREKVLAWIVNDACAYTGQVSSSLEFKPGQPPKVETMSAEDFFDGD